MSALLNFSITGENTTGSATFTLVNEYKFKNVYIEDIKYTMVNEQLEHAQAKDTAGSGIATIVTTITSPLAVKLDFVNDKEVITYSLADGSGETLNDAINIGGLIPYGYAGKTGSGPISTRATMSHSYPYKIISNKPTTWPVGKTLNFDLYFRDINTNGLIKDWSAMSGTTDAFSDICSIDITLRLE